MGDITPRGQYARHNLDAFLRGDLQARSQSYSTLIASGVVTVEEVRRAEGLPPLPEGQENEPTMEVPA
jgi:phage portal protein BeeE